ncbi:NOP58 family protein [Halonotius terrestris]|uniref:NOP58 family protein n=1 Tax=Halonotius terrestris TaxID=2487750 RepID=A0A8J8TBW5_9EURY|nr:NOP5/NOP56 family protein [Halonotius terrestris]TQQ79821.1 NOP58 family protein [Halonotius terrestris]
MSDQSTDTGWFAGRTADDDHRAAIRTGSADAPADWPTAAVDVGFAADNDDYYATLRETTIEAAREAVTEREGADDQQLLHAVRAMDDATRTANELAERCHEWAATQFDDVDSGIEGARDVATRESTDPVEERIVSLAERIDDLTTEADELRSFIERLAPEVAPNLAEMAGSVLAARLISLAGGLDSLAKKPSGTVQVLGAEDALFAHLAGRGPSPKHGIIYTHPYVNGTRPEDRGSAARALAGKLTIAARIDHYSGDFRPEIHDELDDRMATIRARADDGDGGGNVDGDTEGSQ